jgi:hypothetical protein
MAQTQECTHPSCRCPAAGDSKYCSPYCEAAKNLTELSCNCGHADCELTEVNEAAAAD